MMLHTVVSLNDVFPLETLSPYTQHSLGTGKWLSCVRTPRGEIVGRLISTDLADYLNPIYTPGNNSPLSTLKGCLLCPSLKPYS